MRKFDSLHFRITFQGTSSKVRKHYVKLLKKMKNKILLFKSLAILFGELRVVFLRKKYIFKKYTITEKVRKSVTQY